jgi:ketosteroid isomerase-like protein
VYGKEACGKLINQVDMKGWQGTLQWKSLLADISAAGDLGYTHGRFERPAGSGYYLTIWKKTPGGNWKVAFSQGLVLIKGLNQKPIGKQIDPAKADPVTRQVLATEKAFSDYSVKHGTSEAFYRFIADNGMALSPAGPPRTKETFAKAIAEAKKKKETGASKSKLEWQALFSDVSASGDMAYNYGTYDYSITDAQGRTQVSHGYFVTVWKKQPGSGWKFLLDGGNQSH